MQEDGEKRGVLLEARKVCPNEARGSDKISIKMVNMEMERRV